MEFFVNLSKIIESAPLQYKKISPCSVSIMVDILFLVLLNSSTYNNFTRISEPN